MRVCHECGSPALREDYMGWTVCWDCAMFVGAYDCTPDCRTRAQCWKVGPGHTLCGTCYTCFKPNHHCTPDNCKEYN